MIKWRVNGVERADEFDEVFVGCGGRNGGGIYVEMMDDRSGYLFIEQAGKHGWLFAFRYDDDGRLTRVECVDDPKFSEM